MPWTRNLLAVPAFFPLLSAIPLTVQAVEVAHLAAGATVATDFARYRGLQWPAVMEIAEVAPCGVTGESVQARSERIDHKRARAAGTADRVQKPVRPGALPVRQIKCAGRAPVRV